MVARGAAALRVEDTQLRRVTVFNGRVWVCEREATRENTRERENASEFARSFSLFEGEKDGTEGGRQRE